MKSTITLVITAAAAGAAVAKNGAENDDVGSELRRVQIATLTSFPTLYPTYVDTAATDPVSSLRPSRKPCTRSFSVAMYNSIEVDIATLMSSIEDDEDQAHFLGGIVRLAAHDIMDYNPSLSPRMGPDGCFDPDHPNNAGLDTVWCEDCVLTLLHGHKYSHISRADFWVASANAVIHLTSVDNALDMRETFRWGRKDRDSCIGSGQRLPRPSGCQQVEAVFLTRMGLSWREAVALLGAHTLGRGDREVRSNRDSSCFILRGLS
jgi:hypothetical protein